MHLIFIKKLSFAVQFINVNIQKIDSTTLKIYEIVVVIF